MILRSISELAHPYILLWKITITGIMKREVIWLDKLFWSNMYVLLLMRLCFSAQNRGKQTSYAPLVSVIQTPF